MPIVLEKARLNMWNMIGFAFGIAVTAFGWGVTYTLMNTGITEVKAEMVRTNNRIDKINTVILPLPNLQFQTARALEAAAEANKANDETNKRVDRVVETFSGKLDTMISGFNALNVKVEVLNNEVRKGQK